MEMNDPRGQKLEVGATVVYGVAEGGGGAVQLYHGLIKEVHPGAKPWLKVDVDPKSCPVRRRKYARLYSVDRVYVLSPPARSSQRPRI